MSPVRVLEWTGVAAVVATLGLVVLAAVVGIMRDRSGGDAGR